MREALSWIGVTALALVLAFAVAEVILRYSSIGRPIAPEGFFFLENPQNFRNQHSEFGYSAFSRNREVAIYADRESAWVEYDALFTVNNAGLVQQRDIDRTKSYIVVVGDSFTQGQGATPWFYELEKALPDLPLANLGIMGTGVQHWEKAVDWFQERIAGVRKVVVIFITDDFSRPYWFATANQNDLSFCFEASCKFIFARLRDISPVALAQYGREQLQREQLQRDDIPPVNDSLRARVGSLLMKLRTGALLVGLVRNARKWTPKHLEANKKSLETLGARHDVAFMLHLPGKREATEGAWLAESLAIKEFISAIGLPYVDGMRCGLGAADFHKFDGHPNPVGYRKVQQCVAATLASRL